MKTAVIYDLVSKKIKGIIGVSLDSNLSLNVKTGEGYIEIPPNHPICEEQDYWGVKEGKRDKIELVRKPQTVIDAEENIKKTQEEKKQKESTLRSEVPFEVLINHINILEKKLNLPISTLEQIKIEIEDTIKTKLI